MCKCVRHRQGVQRLVDQESKSALVALGFTTVLAFFWSPSTMRSEGFLLGSVVTLLSYLAIQAIMTQKLKADSVWSQMEIGIGLVASFLLWPGCWMVMSLLRGTL